MVECSPCNEEVSVSDILIPVDYWAGRRTLELEIPWVTPEALHMFDLFCKPHHEVLEFGAGGSTLFFARRVSKVVSLEADKDWYRMVNEEAAKKDISNIEMHLVTSVADCAVSVRARQFDVVLVDCDGIDRFEAAKMAIKQVRKDGIVVVDNYDAVYCKNCDVLFAGRLQTAYDDTHWVGRGTKVYYFD